MENTPHTPLQIHDQRVDVLIVGCGAAGMTLALKLPSHLNIIILSKGPLTEASTFYAQGGVAAVIDQNDSLEAHVADTLTAGAGLCDEHVVRIVVEHGPKAIDWLVAQGVEFSPENSAQTTSPRFHLTREGGHSHRRVLHVADATGSAISNALIHQVKTADNITLLEDYLAVDLITSSRLGLPEQRCLGAYVLHRHTNRVVTIAARATVLATGGASKAYLYTSNPHIATGDGIAMAWRAGCSVANMEFNQFHPTCLYHPQAANTQNQTFLITEALRGEGGILRLPTGEPFMPRFDARAELAPRDIVARAIDHEMKRLGIDYVYLDISHKDRPFLQNHFPTIYDKMQNLGIDIATQPIPVVPAAHYTCGGVRVDTRGRTDLQGLYAIGETAYTGLHGANRMASNSLLECLVFAFAAAKDITTLAPHIPESPPLPDWDESQVTNSDEDVVITHNWAELRRFMWDYVGIVRTNKRLQRAKHRVDLLHREIHDYYANYKISSDLLELRNLAVVADLIISCSLQRRESRGLHFTLDYPDRAPSSKNTLLKPFNAAHWRG
ncbi:MAG: L-aspartate oxidase [Gammaproteobacteria bacterium]